MEKKKSPQSRGAGRDRWERGARKKGCVGQGLLLLKGGCVEQNGLLGEGWSVGLSLACKLKWCSLGLFCLLLSCSLGEEPKKWGSRKQAIVGGKPDTRYPAVGVLTVEKKSQFCTATLVAPKLVLSAAHCVSAGRSWQKKGKKLYFRIDLSSGSQTTKEFHLVSGLQTHPGYTASKGLSLTNDLGVFLLAKAVTSTTPMPLSFAQMDQSWVGRKILFLGYGRIQTKPKPVGTDKKYGAEIPIRRVYRDRFETYAKGVSICSGDSGGPGLYTIQGKRRLVGVNSYVQGTQTKNQPNCDGSGFSFRIDLVAGWLQPLLNAHGYTCKAQDDCGGCFACSGGQCKARVIAPQANLCRPCRAPADCGGGSNLCIRRAEGNRCAQACDGQARCCPKGYICQDIGSGLRQCVPQSGACPVVSCQSDAQCGPGEECHQQKCRPQAVTPTPQLCGKCQSDKDCAKGGVCLSYIEGSYCSQPCLADLFCPPGYSCRFLNHGGHQCLPQAGFCSCKADTDCYSKFRCVSGSCQIAGGGKSGDLCDGRRHLCAPDLHCLRAPEGKDRCFQPCQNKQTYPAGSPGSICRQNKYCDLAASCLQVAATTRACLRFCQNDKDCPFGGKCYPQPSGQSLCLCRSDKECRKGFGCNNTLLKSVGLCAPRFSTSSPPCPPGTTCQKFGTQLQICLPPPSQKEGDPCDSLRACVQGTLCLRTSLGGNFCFVDCTSSGTCSKGGACANAPNQQKACICNPSVRCLSGHRCRFVQGTLGTCQPGTDCTQSEQCPAKHQCLKGRCSPIECQHDKDCPLGQSCLQQQCVLSSPEQSGEQNSESTPKEKRPDSSTEAASEKTPEPTTPPESLPEPFSEPPPERTPEPFPLDAPSVEIAPAETASLDAGLDSEPTNESLPPDPLENNGCSCNTSTRPSPLSPGGLLLLLCLLLLACRRPNPSNKNSKPS